MWVAAHLRAAWEPIKPVPSFLQESFGPVPVLEAPQAAILGLVASRDKVLTPV